MKLKIHRKGQRGLTLLEIMVAIAVLTSTLVAFASVFPAAFKLNRQSQASVRAAKHAAAVAEELRAMPVACNSSLFSIAGARKHYIEDYARSKVTGNFDNYYGALQSVEELKDDGFTLDYATAAGSTGKNARPGVYIYHKGNGGNNDSRFWNIEVNVYWPETINGKRVVRSASVISARTGNR